MNHFKKVFQITLFMPIQTIFIPLAVIGIVVGIYKEMVIGSKMGISFSAIKALQYRWNGYFFRIRPAPHPIAIIKIYLVSHIWNYGR